VRGEAKSEKAVLNKAGAASAGSPIPSVAPMRVSVLAATVLGWGILVSVHMPHKAGLWTTNSENHTGSFFF